MAAIDATRVIDRERDPAPPVAEADTPRFERHGEAQAHLGRPTPAPSPPRPRRRLNEALAGIGPVRPEIRVVQEATSCPGLPAANDAVAKAAERADSAPESATVPTSQREPETPGAVVAKDTADLPPPPRPYSGFPAPMADDAAGRRGSDAWADFTIAEGDTTGADIVRALAEAANADMTAARGLGQAQVAMAPLDGHVPLERPPMIIERALAEQAQALRGALPATKRPNPLPGLAIGFSLSLVVGAALYTVLAVG
jgi:hypothetical protein